jgi:uncharacterized protein (DUF1697 family)
MTNLTNILLAQTAEFKATFIAKTEQYAEREFNRASEMILWKEEQWCSFLGLEPRTETRYGSTRITFPKNFYNTYHSRTYANALKKVAQIVRQGRGAFIIKAIDQAEKHYIQSIEKLAFKIQSKGLDIDAIQVTSGFQGVNFECTITDGIKKVRAFTIIAEGEIIRPHYRYLIK